MLKITDLFSGIGGLSLGLERTGGFRTTSFCEIEPFPRRVLAKHWPEVIQYGDVRELTVAQMKADSADGDVLVGGFPCTNISTSGDRVGIDGPESKLWAEIGRLMSEKRWRWVLAENSANLRSAGLGRMLDAFAAAGYDAEWHCIPASALGAPHQRDRIWVLAWPQERSPALLRQIAGGDLLDKFRARQAWTITENWRHPAAVRGEPNRADRVMALGNSVVPIIPEMLGVAMLEFDAGHRNSFAEGTPLGPQPQFGKWRSGAMQYGRHYGLPTLAEEVSAPLTTLQKRDYRSGTGTASRSRRGWRNLNDEVAAATGATQMSAGWCEWLMGYPVGYTDIEPASVRLAA